VGRGSPWARHGASLAVEWLAPRGNEPRREWTLEEQKTAHRLKESVCCSAQTRGWNTPRPSQSEAIYDVRLKSMRTELRLQPLFVVVVNVTTGDTPVPPSIT